MGLSLSFMNEETEDLQKESHREAVLASLDEEQFGLVQLKKNVFEKVGQIFWNIPMEFPDLPTNPFSI